MTRKADKKDTANSERVRGMNFFTSDRNLERFLKRHAPDTLKRQRALFRKIGALAGSEIDAQAQESDALYPATLVQEPDDPVRPLKEKGAFISISVMKTTSRRYIALARWHAVLIRTGRNRIFCLL